MPLSLCSKMLQASEAELLVVMMPLIDVVQALCSPAACWHTKAKLLGLSLRFGEETLEFQFYPPPPPSTHTHVKLT